MKYDQNNLKMISALLDDFKTNLKNRDLFFLTGYQEVFPKILEWHFEFWESEYKALPDQTRIEEFSNYSEISRVLDQILMTIENRVLEERQSYSFFSNIHKHLEGKKDKFIQGDEHQYYYTESFLSIFCRPLFDRIKDSQEKYDIWHHYFPKEWKITEESLQGPSSTITRVILRQFLEWAQTRIWDKKKDWDDDLDEVTKELFPSTDPSMWSKILTFAMQGFGKNRVESFILNPPNFGYIGRIFMFDVSDEDGQNNQFRTAQAGYEESTLRLALYLFGNQFTEELLKQYISQAEKLKYEPDSKEEHLRLSMIEIFKKLLEIRKQMNNKTSQ